LHDELAAVLFDDAQALPQASLAGPDRIGIAFHEGVKDAVDEFGFEASTLVLHPHLDAPVSAPQGEAGVGAWI
jgi:hypothetical protein